MARVNQKPCVSQPISSQTAVRVVDDEHSAGTPANVGIEQLLKNWSMHNVSMVQYHHVCKKFIMQKRMPICRNLSPKMKTIKTKKGEIIDVQDPYTFADGKHDPEELAIETWALYAGACSKDRAYTWAQMEGARKAAWYFIKDWIAPYKKPDTKRQIIFGTCYCLLTDIEDGIDKLNKGFNMFDSINKVVRPEWDVKIPTKKINPWTGRPYEEDTFDENNFKKIKDDWNMDEDDKPAPPQQRPDARTLALKFAEQVTEKKMPKAQGKTSPIETNIWMPPMPGKQVMTPLKIEATPIKTLYFVKKPQQATIDYTPSPMEICEPNVPIVISPIVSTRTLKRVYKLKSDPIVHHKYYAEACQALGRGDSLEKEMEIENVEVCEVCSMDVEEIPSAIPMSIDSPPSAEFVPSLPMDISVEPLEINIDGDEESGMLVVLQDKKKQDEDSEFDIIFGHYNKMRRQAVEEIKAQLEAADPFGLTCKCWQCVEQFLRRNPKALHNQYKAVDENCVLPPLGQKPYIQRVREAHRARCLDVKLSKLTEFQLCIHEFVDWSGEGGLYEVEPMDQDILLDSEIPFDNDDDYAMAFGDSSEPLETQESISKSQNITFVDERPSDEVNTYLGSSVETKDINKDIAESPWNLTQILTRELKVGTYSWTETIEPFNNIGTLVFPKCITDLKNSMARTVLKSIGFVRGGADFRIQFNGNKFNVGRAVVVFLPIMWETNKETFPIQNFANLPHAFLDASVTNSVNLHVPFTHLQSHFCLQKGATFKNDLNTLGTLIIMVLNKLQPGEGAANVMTVNVYCKFSNPEVHQVMWTHDDIVFDDTTGLVAQGEDSIWAKAAATGVGQALGNVLKLMTGGLALGVGDYLAGLIFDKPLDPRPAIPVINRSVPALCHGCGPDNSTRLSLAPISQTVSDPKMLSTKFNDFNLQELLHIPQYLTTFQISTSTELDKELIHLPVCPVYVPTEDITKSDGYLTYRCTALAYLSRAFMYWRGSIVYKFQFITSQFHSMRVTFQFNPLERVGAVLNMEQRMNTNTVIMDIEEQKEFEVTVPYTSIFPWLYCNHFRTDVNFYAAMSSPNPEFLYQCSIGTVGLYMNTQLVAPSNIAQTIDVNVFISAGPDFELAIPVPLSGLSLNPTQKGGFNPTNFQTFYQTSGTKDCIAGNTGELGNKQLIDYLYKLGRIFYQEGKIIYSTPEALKDKWWMCKAASKCGDESDVYSWIKRANELNRYDTTYPQYNYIRGLPAFTTKWRIPADPWKDPGELPVVCDPDLKAQGKVEEYTTTREEATKTIMPTKGASSKEAAPTTISENAMNLQTVMRRYYPLFMSTPIFNVNGFTLVMVPVTPTVIATSQYPIGKYSYLPNLHQIAYFSRLYTYWRGGLRFKFVFQQAEGNDVYVWYDPSKVLDFRILTGYPENEVLANLSLASMCATTHLQGCVEVEVPYQSRYNQLLIDSRDDNRNLLAINGTLFFAIRNRVPNGPDERSQLNLSIFISTADDFVLNLYRGPTNLFEPPMLQNDLYDMQAYVIYGAESHYTTVNDWPRMPGVKPLNSEKFHDSWRVGASRFVSGASKFKDVNAYEAPELPVDNEDDPAEAFGCVEDEGMWDWTKVGKFAESGLKFKPAQLVTNLMPITEENFDQFLLECEEDVLQDHDWAQAQGIFNELKAFKDNIFSSAENASTLLKDINSGRIHQTMNNMSDFVATVNDKVQNGLKSATAEAVTKYSILSAEIMTIGAFIFSLRECITKPDVKNLIMLAITTAGTLGFAFTSALHNVIANVVGWALGQQRPQAQALDGATADWIDGHGKTICTVVAVIGTVFYAYLFDILPSLTTIKAAIKQIFEGEDEKEEKPKQKSKAKAHALGVDLRAAHFSVMGISALDKVFNKSMEYVQKFLDWILDRENPEVISARTSEEHRDMIMKCVEELDFLDNEEYYTYAKHDPFIHNRFYKLQSDINTLTRVAIEQKLDSRVCSLISECRKRSQKVLRDLEKDAPKPILRYDPFCICLAGESGTGKTKIMHKVARWVQEEMDLPEYNLCYPKGVKDEFWSGYKNQPIVFWDEFAQSRKMDEVIPEFMTLRGSTPVMLNMAAVNDKGKYFTSQCIILTTNVPYENFNTVRDQKAFKRRRHIVVHMDHKRGYNSIRLQNSNYDAFPKWEHCNFSIKSSMSNKTLRGNLDYDQIEAIVRTRVRNWHANQIAILRNSDIPAELPRGLVPIHQDVVADVAAMVEDEMEEMRRADQEQEEYERQMQEQLEDHITQAIAAVPVNNPTEELAEATPPVPAPRSNVPSRVPSVASEPVDEIAVKPGCSKETEELVQATLDEDDLEVDNEHEFAKANGDDKPGTISQLAYDLYDASFRVLNGNKPATTVSVIEVSSETSSVMTEEEDAMNEIENYYDCPKIKPCVIEPWTSASMNDLILDVSTLGFQCKGELPPEEEVQRQSFIRTFKYIPLRFRITIKPWIIVKNFFSDLWRAAVEVFKSIKQAIFNFVENNPKLAKIIGTLTLFAGVGATLYAFGGIANKPVDEIECEGFYQHGPQKMARLKVSPEGYYDHGPVRMARHKVNAEGSTDPVGFDIRRKIHSAVCPIAWSKTHDNKRIRMKCVRVGGSLVLLPKHFFDRRKKDDEFQIYHRFQHLSFLFDPEKIYRHEDKDWVLYDLGWRVEPAPHIFKYFISQHSLGASVNMSALLCGAEADGTLTMSSCSAKGLLKFKYEDVYGDAVYCQTGWKVDVETSPGDCGSLLCGLSKNLPPPGKIIGMHVAGYTDRPTGYAVLITREQIEELVQKSRLSCLEQPPVCMGVDVEVETKDLRIVPQGDFSIVGRMDSKLRVMQPPKSDLMPTPWYNDVQSIMCPKKPAHLMPFINSEGERISPLSIALTKYGQPNCPLPNNSIKKVKTFLKDYFIENLTSHTGKRLFTEKEAILGIEGIDFAERINMKSSAGWPYQVEERGERGKFHFFDEEGNITHMKLKERLETRITLAENLKRVPSLWRDCLKDELRPIEKVDQGKTRLFTIAPLDFTICVRMYFFDFVIAFYSASETNFFSAVGIDPESYAWTELYQFLREHSDKALAGDFSCFDGGLKPEVFEIVCEVINNWYDDEEQNKNVRTILFHEMLHTMQLVNDCVYMTHYGNPSGNPLTVIINTIGNLVYFLCAWLHIYPEKSCQDFFDQVHAKLYGDDAIITVTKKADKFNQNSVTKAFASLGIKFTPESKTEDKVADFRPLEETTFLKRGFRKDPEVGNHFVLPVMSEDTLHSFLFYYRKTESSIEEQLQMNMRAAVDFAFFHGREFYNNYNEKWKDCMRLHGFKPLSISYEEQLDKFLIKCCAAGLLSPATAQAMQEFMDFTNSKWPRRMAGVMESTLYYLGAVLGIGRAEEVEPTDDRWAVSIPSGEGKSTLAKQYPHIFVDHDELLLPAFASAGTNLKELPWRAKNARQHDFPAEDRRILLVHSPANTNRRLIGCFITPTPTYIRSNVIHRLAQRKPKIMEFNTRNCALLQIARKLEPGLFAEIT